MTPEEIRVMVDTHVRDIAYDGWNGKLTEESFNGMAAEIAAAVLDGLKEGGVI